MAQRDAWRGREASGLQAESGKRMTDGPGREPDGHWFPSFQPLLGFGHLLSVLHRFWKLWPCNSFCYGLVSWSAVGILSAAMWLQAVSPLRPTALHKEAPLSCDGAGGPASIALANMTCWHPDLHLACLFLGIRRHAHVSRRRSPLAVAGLALFAAPPVRQDDRTAVSFHHLSTYAEC